MGSQTPRAHRSGQGCSAEDRKRPPGGQWADHRRVLNGVVVQEYHRHLAVLAYEDARGSDEPRASVLAFYESAYQASARLAGWPAGTSNDWAALVGSLPAAVSAHGLIPPGTARR